VDGTGSTLIAGGALTLGQNSGPAPLLSITNGGTALVGLMTSPFSSGGGFAIGANGDVILNVAAGQTRPDITTTGALRIPAVTAALRSTR